MGRGVTIGLVAIILVLVLLLTVQFGKVAQAQTKAQEAQYLAEKTYMLMQTMKIRCFARPTEIIKLADCITPVLAKNDFEVMDFRNFNEFRNETGVLIINNKGKKTYESDRFTLLKNGVEVKTGCHISGEILPEYTCRFDLHEVCERGDVFDIMYGEGEEAVSIAKRTC